MKVRIRTEEVEIVADNIMEKTVTTHGNGAHVLVPLAWVGRTVKVVLLPAGEG